MTNLSLISTFKCKVFLIKIIAYADLNNTKCTKTYTQRYLSLKHEMYIFDCFRNNT